MGGFSAKAVDNRASGPGWARAYEVSRMAALPHLLHKEQWEMKRLLVCWTRFAYLTPYTTQLHINIVFGLSHVK